MKSKAILSYQHFFANHPPQYPFQCSILREYGQRH